MISSTVSCLCIITPSKTWPCLAHFRLRAFRTIVRVSHQKLNAPNRLFTILTEPTNHKPVLQYYTCLCALTLDPSNASSGTQVIGACGKGGRWEALGAQELRLKSLGFRASWFQGWGSRACRHRGLGVRGLGFGTKVFRLSTGRRFCRFIHAVCAS